MRRARSVAVLGVVIVALAGCTAVPARDGAAVAEEAAPTREAKARQVFADFQTANNKANKEISDALISAIETGPVLEADLASYKNIRAGRDAPVREFFYEDPVFHVPEGDGDPAWFMVDAAAAEDLRKGLLFVREDDGYKLRNTVYFGPGGMPELARAGGGAAPTAVPALDAARLSREHAALLNDPNRADGDVPGHFVPGDHTTRFFLDYCLGEAHRQFTGYGFTGGCHWRERTDDPDFALRTADGRALVWYSVALTDSYRRGANKDTGFDRVYLPGWYNPFVPVDKETYSYSTEGSDESFLRHFYKDGYTGEAVVQFAALVTPDGDSIDVIAHNRHPLAASGS
ncbi:hypothetical protein [Actinocorallia herbida]|uniref:hypothetical protein n=1 Tax=Actinocorallia herbida TaxID=58109 RepID=UPI0011CD8C0D|nr:hypothetical protein [Actinocorallia herbida]